MAIVISQADKKAVERAIERCKKEHPSVRILGFGKFEVSSSQDKANRYTVTFSGKRADMVADCTCKAGAKGQVCKHVVSVGSIFRSQVIESSKERHDQPDQEAEPKKYALACPDCDETFYSANPNQFFCPKCETKFQAEKAATVSTETAPEEHQNSTGAANISELPLAAGWLECSECHQKYPESVMNPSATGYYCDSCLLFGSAT